MFKVRFSHWLNCNTVWKMFLDSAGHGSCSVCKFHSKKICHTVGNNIIIPNAISLVQFFQDNWHIWGWEDERRLTCKDWVSVKNKELMLFYKYNSYPNVSLLTAKTHFITWSIILHVISVVSHVPEMTKLIPSVKLPQTWKRLYYLKHNPES